MDWSNWSRVVRRFTVSDYGERPKAVAQCVVGWMHLDQRLGSCLAEPTGLIAVYYQINGMHLSVRNGKEGYQTCGVLWGGRSTRTAGL